MGAWTVLVSENVSRALLYFNLFFVFARFVNDPKKPS